MWNIFYASVFSCEFKKVRSCEVRLQLYMLCCIVVVSCLQTNKQRNIFSLSLSLSLCRSNMEVLSLLCAAVFCVAAEKDSLADRTGQA